MGVWGQVVGVNPLPRVFAVAGTLLLRAQAFWRAKPMFATTLLLSCVARAAGTLRATISSCDGSTGASIWDAYARWFYRLADQGRRVTKLWSSLKTSYSFVITRLDRVIQQTAPQQQFFLFSAQGAAHPTATYRPRIPFGNYLYFYSECI